ncbi:helix-turn-helix transcriptional regulator [Nocardia sp. NPDC050799]|uniref:helix-turn-helix domain-containing protein n=1 Tax=Nocardia sp. NPDC050799 TaxID=3154842 RepID=UPI00340C187A
MPTGELRRAVGANLARIRQQRGVSQERFAHEVLKLSLRYVSDLEAGKRNLTLKSVESIAEALGVTPIELLKQ